MKAKAKYVTLLDGTKTLNFCADDMEFEFYIVLNSIHLTIKTRNFIIQKAIYGLSLSEDEKKLINKYYKEYKINKDTYLEDILDLDFFTHTKEVFLVELNEKFREALKLHSVVNLDSVNGVFKDVLQDFEIGFKRKIKEKF